MQRTEGILFMLLLISLQLARNHSEDAVNSTSSRSSINSTPMSPTTFNVSSDRTSTERRNISDSPNDSTITENTTPGNKITSILTPTFSLHSLLLPTTHPPTFTTKDVKHRISSLGMPANTSRSYEATTYFKSFESEPNSVTTTTSNIRVTITVSHNTTQIDGLTFRPTKNISNTTAMLLTTKISAITSELSTSVPTANLLPKATDGSTEAREAQDESHSNGGVIFGTIVGAMLGSALIGLVGYLICGKRKPESFGHQRLYDDTRNDPVLRLDAISEPFSANFGDLSYCNPMAANENHNQNHKETSYNAIPMDDITSSQPSSEMHKARC